MSDEEKLAELARTSDLASLEVFNTRRMSGVGSLAPLTKARGLRRFVVGDGRVPDLAPLTELPLLEEIFIDAASVPSFAPLAAMKALRKLHVGKQYAELRGLALSIDTLGLMSPVTIHLDCLEGFRIRSLHIGSPSTPSGVHDGSAMPSLPGLEELHLSTRAMTSARGLANLTSVRVLDIGSNKKLTSLDGLEALAALEILVCHSTSVSSLAPLSALPLKSLALDASTKVRDPKPLFSCTTLRRLDLGRTGVKSVQGIAALRSLEVLYLRKTKVADIAPLAGLPLRELSIAETAVSDVSVLAELPALESLYASDTSIDDPDPIASHPTLARVSMRGTPLASDAAAVREIERAKKEIRAFDFAMHPTKLGEGL